MQSYTYLLINFFTIIICFIFSFYHKIKFYKHFGSFLVASIIVAIPFILWDAWFTKINVWWFNDNYITGYRILGLPIEEIMFFICIPFSCVFTFYCLNKFFNLSFANNYNKVIVYISIGVCLLVAIFFYNKIYPFITAIATASILFYLYFIAKVQWIGQASFVYLILMIGFFPVNGILTGTGLNAPIVNYNTYEILNIRMLTIPIEDAVYGYSLFMLNIYLFLLLKRRKDDSVKNENLVKIKNL